MSETGTMAGTVAAATSNAVHAWDRFDRTWMVMFHLAVGVPTVIALVASGVDPLRWAGLLVAVTVVVGARHLAVRRLTGTAEGNRRQLLVGLLWAAASLAAMVVLVNADEVFFFAIYGLFPQAFVMLPRNWAMGFSAALVPAVLLGAEGVSTFEDSPCPSSGLPCWPPPSACSSMRSAIRASSATRRSSP